MIEKIETLADQCFKSKLSKETIDDTLKQLNTCEAMLNEPTSSLDEIDSIFQNELNKIQTILF